MNSKYSFNVLPFFTLSYSLPDNYNKIIFNISFYSSFYVGKAHVYYTDSWNLKLSYSLSIALPLQDDLSRILLSKLSRWDASPPVWQTAGGISSFQFLWILPALPHYSALQHWGRHSEVKVRDMPVAPSSRENYSLWVVLLRALSTLGTCLPLLL